MSYDIYVSLFEPVGTLCCLVTLSTREASFPLSYLNRRYHILFDKWLVLLGIIS